MRRDSQDAGDWNVMKEYTTDNIVCHVPGSGVTDNCEPPLGC